MSHWTEFTFTLPKNHNIEHVERFIERFESESSVSLANRDYDNTVWRCSLEGTLSEVIPLLNDLHSKYSINPHIEVSTYFGDLIAK